MTELEGKRCWCWTGCRSRKVLLCPPTVTCCAGSWLECRQYRWPSTAGTPALDLCMDWCWLCGAPNAPARATEWMPQVQQHLLGVPRCWGTLVMAWRDPRAGSPCPCPPENQWHPITQHSSPPLSQSYHRLLEAKQLGLDFSIVLILKSQFVSDLLISIGERCTGTVKPLQGCNLQT